MVLYVHGMAYYYLTRTEGEERGLLRAIHLSTTLLPPGYPPPPNNITPRHTAYMTLHLQSTPYPTSTAYIFIS